MPSGGYSQEKLELFRQKLLSEKEKAESLIQELDNSQRKGSRESGGDMSSYSLDFADLSSDTSQQERDVYMLDTEVEKLRQINQALRRIYNGTYGICEECTELIPEARLKILPFARLCVKCKALEEKNRPVYYHPEPQETEESEEDEES